MHTKNAEVFLETWSNLRRRQGKKMHKNKSKLIEVMHRRMKNTYLASKHRPFKCDIRSCTDNKTCSERPGGCKNEHREGWESSTDMHYLLQRLTQYTTKCPEAKLHYSFKMGGLIYTNSPAKEKKGGEKQECPTFRKKPLLIIYRKNERGKRDKFQIYPNHPRLYLIHLIMVVGENPSDPQNWRAVFFILKNFFSPN